jgi:broad specificity phosphatase PhoE
MRLVLCRHAPAADVAAAVALAHALRALPVAAVYSSPLDRARTTAEQIATIHRLKPVVVDDLREIDFGEVEGLGFDDLPPDLQRGLLENPTRVRFPGGETYAELRDRVVAAFADVTAHHEGETVVAVSHAGAIRAALAAWLLIPDEAVFRLDQRDAAVNVIEWHEGTPLIRVVNATEP